MPEYDQKSLSYAAQLIGRAVNLAESDLQDPSSETSAWQDEMSLSLRWDIENFKPESWEVFLTEDDRVHDDVVAAIGFFDRNNDSLLSDFHRTVANASALIMEEKQLHDDIVKRFTPDTAKTGDKLAGS